MAFGRAGGAGQVGRSLNATVPCSVREIARRLGRSPSTISRELRRNARLAAATCSTGPRLAEAIRAGPARRDGHQHGRAARHSHVPSLISAMTQLGPGLFALAR